MDIIKSYLEVLKRKGIPIQKVYLFGSQAKGTARNDSDIDLLIISPVFSGMPYGSAGKSLAMPLLKY